MGKPQNVGNDKSHPRVNGGATRVDDWSLGIEIVNAPTRKLPTCCAGHGL